MRSHAICEEALREIERLGIWTRGDSLRRDALPRVQFGALRQEKLGNAFPQFSSAN